MSKKTTIYVLFKEFPDPNGRGKSAPYIQDSVDYLTCPDALMQDWIAISDVLDYFAYEDANKYYDDYNLEGLLDVARTFPEEYPDVFETITSEIQRIGLTSRTTQTIVKTAKYFLWGQNVTDDLLGDMAEQEKQHKETLAKVKRDVNHQLMPKDKEYEPCVLLQEGAVPIKGGIIHITMMGRSDVRLNSVDSIDSLHNWFSQHRFPYRHYSFNKKHGDANNRAGKYKDSTGSWKRGAQLLTGTARTRALLKKAVGDSSTTDDLWYYDDANTCFIYFENQGDTPQHEYHAYHLHPGDKNYNKIDIRKLKVVQAQIP